MQDDDPILLSWKGGFLLFVTVAVIVFWFLSLADRAELYFTANVTEYSNGNLSGVMVLPADAGRFPANKLGSGGVVSVLLAFLTVSATAIGRKVYDWKLGVGSGIVTFWLCYFVLVSQELWITVRGGVFSTTIEGLSYLILTLSIVVAIAPFTTPLVPRRIAGHADDQIVDRYLRKQWKVAQGLLSIGLVGAIGGSIPAMSGAANSVTYLGMLSLVGVLFTPFLVGALVFVYRTHRIELDRRV